MNPVFARFFTLAFLIGTHPTFAFEMPVSKEELHQEKTWLQSLGFTVPEGGVILESPWSFPLSKRSFINPTNWYRRVPADEKIDPIALRSDLALLQTAFEKIYGGYESASRCINLESMMANWSNYLEIFGNFKIAATIAFEPFSELMECQLDNHTAPLIQMRFGSGSEVGIIDGRPTESCTQLKFSNGHQMNISSADAATQPHFASLGSENSELKFAYQAWPSKYGHATQITCGEQQFAITPVWFDPVVRHHLIRNLSGENPDEPNYRRISQQIEYLRLPSFSVENGEKMLQLAGKLPRDAGNSKTLIVDLRENDGGDASNSFPLLSRWVDLGKVFKQIGISRRLKKSCLTEATWWGYIQVSLIGRTMPLPASLLKPYQSKLDALFQESEEGCPVTWENFSSSWGWKERDWSPAPGNGKNIMVIVDRGCGSDCEFITSLLGSQSHVLIVGENTYGVGQFTQPHYFVLPNTRIPFRISSGISDLYGDERSFDGYGFNVDVLLSKQEDWSAEALTRLANRL